MAARRRIQVAAAVVANHVRPRVVGGRKAIAPAPVVRAITVRRAIRVGPHAAVIVAPLTAVIAAVPAVVTTLIAAIPAIIATLVAAIVAVIAAFIATVVAVVTPFIATVVAIVAAVVALIALVMFDARLAQDPLRQRLLGVLDRAGGRSRARDQRHHECG